MRKLFVLTMLGLLTSNPAFALDYLCKVRDIGNGFISDTVGLRFEPGASTGVVFDGVIRIVHEEPISVKLKDRGNNRYRFTYRINNFPATPSPVDINYRIELDTSKNTISVRGLITGVENSILGKGTCEQKRWTP
ncbi:MAG: hypothetical protein AAF999_02650 [Pseudomonadota bacterium]